MTVDMRKILLAVFLPFAFHACVTPPRIDRAQVLPEKELQVIATIKRGKDYTQAGRLDLAEYQFRKVIKAGVKSNSVYNNLGFALQSQGRLDEAEEMFRNALALEPRNLAARDNLAKLLVMKERLPEARKEFLTVLADYNTLTKRELLDILGTDFGVADVTTLNRNLSMLEYLDGRFDEALCYSRRAFETSPDAVQTGQHTRLLLSLGMIGPALELLKSQVAAWQATAPAKVLIDLVIAAYAAGEYGQAEEAESAILNRVDVEPRDRQTARLLRLLLTSRSAAALRVNAKTLPSDKPPESLDILASTEEREAFDALAEEFPNLCKSYTVDPDRYWPESVRTEIESQMQMMCQNDELAYPGSNE